MYFFASAFIGKITSLHCVWCLVYFYGHVWFWRILLGKCFIVEQITIANIIYLHHKAYYIIIRNFFYVVMTALTDHVWLKLLFTKVISLVCFVIIVLLRLLITLFAQWLVFLVRANLYTWIVFCINLKRRRSDWNAKQLCKFFKAYKHFFLKIDIKVACKIL